MRLVLSHTRLSKFKHNFEDTLNQIFRYANATESTIKYLLHLFNEWFILWNKLSSIDDRILTQSDFQISLLFLFNRSYLSVQEEKKIETLPVSLFYQQRDLMMSAFKFSSKYKFSNPWINISHHIIFSSYPVF